MKSRLGFAWRVKTIAVGLLLTSGLVVRVEAATDSDIEEDENNFRDDVVVCEEAVAHAIECCGFEVQGDACRYYHYWLHEDCGCNGGSEGNTRRDVRPVLSIGEGRRIAETTCEAMTAPDADADADADGLTKCAVLHDLLQRNNETSSSTPRNCN